MSKRSVYSRGTKARMSRRIPPAAKLPNITASDAPTTGRFIIPPIAAPVHAPVMGSGNATKPNSPRSLPHSPPPERSALFAVFCTASAREAIPLSSLPPMLLRRRVLFSP